MNPKIYPSDVEILTLKTTTQCICCGQELMDIWEAQCCKICLDSQIKAEDSKGWHSLKNIEDYDFKAGELIRVWWRGDIKSAVMRMVLAVGEEDGELWLIVVDPSSNGMFSWGSYMIRTNIVPLLRGGHIGIQKIL